MNKRVRIKDIAEEAKVSRGTVDRVLHNRGKVAPDVVVKVKKAIENLGYSPNIFARTLANNKEYRIATLIPSSDRDVFWEQPQIGILRAYEATRDFGLIIQQFFFNMDHPESFVEEADKLICSKPDGILMATEFYRESIDFYNKVKALNIPLISFNTHLKELKKVGYIGQDSYQSGKLAGRLFDISIKSPAKILMLHLGTSVDNAMHIMDKEKGLSDYFEEREDKRQIISEEFDSYQDADKLGRFLTQIFERHQGIEGIFVTNSRAHNLLNALNVIKHPEDLCIVGFDLIEENCAFLREGKINFLINQDPIRQGNLGFLTLADHLLFQKDEVSLTFLPLDVVMPENLDLYLKSDTDTLSEIRTKILVA